MTGAFRSVLALVLCLMLVATSASMASARGQMRDAAGQMVLCTGTGPVTVLIDADGQPIGPPHICPDCAMSVFAGLAAPFALAHAPGRAGRLSFVAAPPASVHSDLPVPVARGPPAV